MTPDELATWMREQGYVDQQGRLASGALGDDLGMHRTAVIKWLNDEHPIDRRTELALETLARRRKSRRSRKGEPVVAA